MEATRLDELKPGKLIGLGACGRVFQAKDANGRDCAVKIFHRPSISPELLAQTTQRLEAGGWPKGIMPVEAGDFSATPPYWITPLRLTAHAEGKMVPDNLHTHFDEHPGTSSWKTVKSLARALAQLHERRVVHGNLKPGNVFFSDNGDLLLSDWAMGNMPGTAEFSFTDAVLYQSPEQLRDTRGYLGHGAYRWDVFAFGVLAFRLLTGRFPRCHESFLSVAPLPGQPCKPGIQVDLAKLADSLEGQPTYRWPDGARNPLEAGFREWIDRCLPLDPTQRPATMIEVLAGFEALEKRSNKDTEREALLNQRRHAEQRAWRARLLAGASVVSTIALGVLWYLSFSQNRQNRREERAEINSLRLSTREATLARDELEGKLVEAGIALTAEQAAFMDRLKASRTTGDQLFKWAMEKGNRTLPPLDGREVRLKQLEEYFKNFVQSTANDDTLASERSRANLQLAEISISAGDFATGTKRLSAAVTDWRGAPMPADQKLRLATDWLQIALLRQREGDPDAGASFVGARKALEAVPQTEIDLDRLHQLLASLDFHEAQLLSSRGDDRQAMEQLMRATETLNRLADQRPDLAILRSELASCYLSSASVLDGMGNLGDAREVRALAATELQKMLKDSPSDFQLRLDLAGCYSAMAESAVFAGDISGAESFSKAATQLLDRLIVEQPENAEAVARKATQLGLIAGIQRDRGLTIEAMKGYEEGVRILDSLHASAPDNSLISFGLAKLWWQKGRMTGMAGNRDKEIVLLSDARELLMSLDKGQPSQGLLPAKIRTSIAYLTCDLGHALQLAGKKDDSRKTFAEAVQLWTKLLETRPQSEEYSESLAWCQQRLDDLK